MLRLSRRSARTSARSMKSPARCGQPSPPRRRPPKWMRSHGRPENLPLAHLHRVDAVAEYAVQRLARRVDIEPAVPARTAEPSGRAAAAPDGRSAVLLAAAPLSLGL